MMSAVGTKRTWRDVRLESTGAKQTSRRKAATSVFVPNETWMHGTTLPGRAGTSNAFSAAYDGRIVPLIWNKRRYLELGELADRSFKVQAQLILVQTLVREV